MTGRMRSAAAIAAVAMVAACSGGGGDGNDPPPPAAPAMSLSAASVAFDATVAGAAAPAAKTVTITNSGGGTLAQPAVAVSYPGAGGWLDATVSGTSASYTLTLRPNTTALAATDHSATVTLTSVGASNSPKTVAVSWTVTAAQGPVIALTDATLGFTAAAAGADPAAQTVTITNAGTGDLGTITVSDDAVWLDATVAGDVVTVQPVTGALTAGPHVGHVAVSASGASSPATITVNFDVTSGTMAVSPASIDHTLAAGATWSTTLQVSNTGAGALATPTVSDDAAWLTTTVSGSTAPYTITVNVTAPATANGYNATITIASTGATNTPVTIPVTLTVTAVNTGGIDTSTAGSAVETIHHLLWEKRAACYEIAPRALSEYQATVTAVAADVQAAVDAGKLTYVRSQADACAAWATNADCAALDWSAPEPSSCQDMATGLVAASGACADSVECATGYCSFAQGTCPGACVAAKTAGQACDVTDDCVSGLACVYSSGLGVCGTPPTPGALNQTCAAWDGPACADGLFCDWGGTNKCQARQPAGSGCKDHPACAVGLGCTSPDGQTLGACRPWAGLNEGCASAVCGDGLYCSAAAGTKCVDMPRAGDSCAETGWCWDSSACDTSSETCVAGTVPVGGACDFDTLLCVVGATCNYDAGSSSWKCAPEQQWIDSCYGL